MSTMINREKLEGKSPESSIDDFTKQVVEEANNEIKYRTLSWQKATLLLFGEYVCLAILSLSWSWSVIGWVGGALLTFGLGLLTAYNSYTLWQFCMRHPDVSDICELGAFLFPKFPKAAYEVVSFMLLTNNVFIVGFHVFTASKIFNTLSDSAICTVAFNVIATIIGIVVSFPRTLNHVSMLSIISAIAMGIAILLFLVYSGIESAPLYGYGGNYPTQGEVQTSIGAPPGTGFVPALNAALNIAFLWFGQALYPSFIAEMRRPQDFPKAVACLTILEIILFMVVGGIGYHFHGQYATAPSIGSLREPWARKSAFAFVLVPTIIIGTIYAHVAAKNVFMRMMKGSKHVHSNTFIGWGAWLAIMSAIWVIGFILANVIPSMGDFLAIIGAAFSSFFGLIFWALAYWAMHEGYLFKGARQTSLTVINIVIFLLGLFMFVGGLYSSITAIAEAYAGTVRSPFSCASNAV